MTHWICFIDNTYEAHNMLKFVIYISASVFRMEKIQY